MMAILRTKIMAGKSLVSGSNAIANRKGFNMRLHGFYCMTALKRSRRQNILALLTLPECSLRSEDTCLPILVFFFFLFPHKIRNHKL